jgi:endonuclease III related protein
MDSTEKQCPSIRKIYRSLFAAYGPQHWWPARTRAEMIIGAILTQNTAWTNVEKALSNLRKNSALNFQTLEKAPTGRIAAWIRPAGYYNQKTAYLKALAEMVAEHGSITRLFRLDTPELRKQLLSVKGIGPETADSILLYAAKRPVFVVDAYTRRLLAHHGYQKDSVASYDDIAGLFTTALPAGIQLFNEYHALIVRWGKDHPRREP